MRNKVHSAGRAVLIILALSGLLVPVTDLALPQPVSGLPSVPAGDLIPRAWIPLVMMPEVPDVAIYDRYGTLQDWDWLVSVFGAVTLDVGTGAAKVIELREVIGDIALIVRVENVQGEPIVGQEVVFYWPDAPSLLPYQQACGLDRGLIIPTNENGKAEFGMGPGAWYNPDAGMIGPHQVWVVREGTDCLRGLGWFDDHIHLDSVWVLP